MEVCPTQMLVLERRHAQVSRQLSLAWIYIDLGVRLAKPGLTNHLLVGPRLWNVLPGSLTTLQSNRKFKCQLTKLLFELDDMPPVHGYARSHGNSLPEVLARAN